MSVRVAVPILFVSIKINLVRGRRWSVIEHAILSHLCEQKSSISDLAKQSELPSRLIVEALVRLMKVGWVEISETKDGVLLRTSERGKIVAGMTELPRVSNPMSRIGTFAVCALTGELFKARDLNIYNKATFRDLKERNEVIELETSKSETKNYRQGEAISLLLDEDEEYVSFDPIGPRESDRYAFVTVRGDRIEGLPPEASSELRQSILAKAGIESTQSEKTKHQVNFERRALFEIPVDIKLDSDCLIVGGDEHRNTVLTALKKARSWFVLHSTFINIDSFKYLIPYFKQASDRGVRISLLWGQSEDSPSQGQTLKAVQECLALMHSEDGGALVSFQPFSTGSHAKTILYDTQDLQTVAVIGSCNWLSSSFDRCELSLKLTDPRIVKLIAFTMSELARPMKGHWSALSGDLAGYAVNLGRKEISESTNATAKLVMGPSHNSMLLEARDNAKARIVIGSHRVSSNARSLAIIPMLAAIRKNDINTIFRYGKIEKELGSIEGLIRDDEKEAMASNMSFQPLDNPIMHAKFLFWDKNDLVITSQNFLSADPGSELFSELGIHISSNNIATKLEAKFKKIYSV